MLAVMSLAVAYCSQTEASEVSQDAREALNEFADERGLKGIGDAYRVVLHEMGENGLSKLEEAYKLRKMQRQEAQALKQQQRVAELEAQALKQQQRVAELEAQALEQREQLMNKEMQHKQRAAELEAQALEQRKQLKAMLVMQRESALVQWRTIQRDAWQKGSTWGGFEMAMSESERLKTMIDNLAQQIAELE